MSVKKFSTAQACMAQLDPGLRVYLRISKLVLLPDTEGSLTVTPAPGSSVFVLGLLISTSLLYLSCSKFQGLLVCSWLRHLCPSLHGTVDVQRQLQVLS